ncbi:ABC transporter permease [Thalassotalea mangrovi]|uniref:Transport permease protein n=1 Tax=Thalassotalea mangrovi TaxID=2572245 RepID=A0A4U1B4M6_9GAMM|nr:ABC transporter permease [Thalassotalea mangrovi]TKB45169.1 ABC transporter [Thalassotalea mangrovi]
MAQVKARAPVKVWQDVVFAIFIREIRSKFDDKVGISWAVIQPVSFIFILSFIRGRMDGGLTHTMPTFIFMMYGMIMIQLFLSTLASTATAIHRNKALFSFRQVQPLSAVMANALFEILVKVAVIIVLWVAVYFIGVEMRLDDPLMVLLMLLNVWLLAASLGLIMALAKEFVVEIDKIRNLITRPMFFISGVFFSLQDISEQYWPFLNWNPLVHSIELSRQAAYSGYQAQGVSLTYLNLTTMMLLITALIFYQLSWRQVVSR